MGARYGWYGDDFTGASDTLATLCRRGVRAFLYLGVPSQAQLDAVGPLEAIGIAGAARSMGPDAMRDALEPVASFLQRYGVRIAHYKCCSTFDSAPHVGNLAVALGVLQKRFRDATTLVVGGQPSLGRYCAFGTLFARGGTESAVFRIDRHPVMSNHPVTPMDEADLRLHLQRQGLDGIELFDWTQIESRQPLDPAASRDMPVLFDALTQTHVEFIGGFMRDVAQHAPLVVLGASSVAESWFFQRKILPLQVTPLDKGPVLAIAGSLSQLSRQQKDAARSFVKLTVSPQQIASGLSRDSLMREACVLLSKGKHVFISSAPSNGAPRQSLDGVAQATARLVTEIVSRHPVRRMIVAGGDTSSHVVQALGFWGLGYAGALGQGVPLVRGRSEDPSRDGMLLMLKGGQMGSETLFEDFLQQTTALADASAS